MLNTEKIEKSEKITCSSPEFVTSRLDKFLLENFPQYSRAYFQKLIEQDLILVNSQINKKSSYKLKKDDLIQIIKAIKEDKQ